MGANTKIVVLKMKNVVIAMLFGILILVLIVLFVLMFKGKSQGTSDHAQASYIPGVYTNTITLNNQDIEIEVSVSKNRIESIRFANLQETVTTMFPLMESALESVTVQIINSQSTKDLVYSDDMKYTSELLVNTINKAIEQAKVK